MPTTTKRRRWGPSSWRDVTARGNLIIMLHPQVKVWTWKRYEGRNMNRELAPPLEFAVVCFAPRRVPRGRVGERSERRPLRRQPRDRRIAWASSAHGTNIPPPAKRTNITSQWRNVIIFRGYQLLEVITELQLGLRRQKKKKKNEEDIFPCRNMTRVPSPLVILESTR